MKFNFTDEIILAVWRKGKTVAGYDPNKFRQDSAGAWMTYVDYGNINSKYGWEIDHIIPRSISGNTLGILNLRPIHKSCNKIKGTHIVIGMCV